MSDQHFSRREVLTAASAGLALTVLGGCSTDKKAKPALITTGTVDIGPASAYPAGSVSTKYQPEYGFVVVNESGPVLAVRPVCTHLGCSAPWKEEVNQFVCPCHGSKFNMLGQVTKGPAKKPMNAVPALQTAAGTLTINLDKLNAPV